MRYLVLAIVLLIAGCQAESWADKIGSYKIDLLPDGTMHLERGDHVSAGQKTLTDSAGPTTQNVSFTGVETSLAGTWQPPEKPLAAYGLEKQATIYYAASALFGVAAVVALFLKQPVLCAGCVVASAGMGLMPNFLNTYGNYILGGIIVILVASASWAIAKRIFRTKEHNIAVAGAVKLVSEGKPEAAMAVVRESPVVREAWNKAKK